MLELRPTDFGTIQKWFIDFQKKSHCFEMPPEEASYLGIFQESVLVGYFILLGWTDGILEINQGYLQKDARHSHLSYESMNLLQEQAKTNGYKKIVLKASRSLRAYTQFMGNLGFKPESIIYSKEI